MDRESEIYHQHYKSWLYKWWRRQDNRAKFRRQAYTHRYVLVWLAQEIEGVAPRTLMDEDLAVNEKYILTRKYNQHEETTPSHS